MKVILVILSCHAINSHENNSVLIRKTNLIGRSYHYLVTLILRHMKDMKV